MMASKITSLLILTLLFIVTNAVSQAVTVDGHAFLELEEVHDNIKVKFERLAPSYLVDSAYTNSSGYYSINLESGIYKPTFSKSGHIGINYAETPLYQNTTLSDQTLEKSGLSGELSGQLTSGIYKVDATIYIPENESLIIEPGTVLKFKQDVVFEVYGELNATGTIEDSIIFTRFSEDVSWKGIDFKENSSDLSILKYCIVEFSDDRGISVYHCSPAISNSLIQKNSHRYIAGGEEEQQGGGAGISLQYSNSNIEKVVVKENTGSTLGVGIYCISSNSHISNSMILHNINPAVYNDFKPGGGIFCNAENNITIENSVICYNTNNLGGGICIGDNPGTTTSNVNVVNCIISENHVDGDYPEGGGIYTYNEPSLTVTNTLFWNNTLEDVNCDDPWLCINVTVNNNSDSCDAYGNLTLDPQFVSPGTENFYLESGSPCIDAGLNSMVTTETDFLHNYRIWDGNYDNDSIVDIGVYEYGSQANPVGIIKDLASKKVIVFPNPTEDYITVNIKNILQVGIFDNSGRLILTSNKTRIDLSDLNTGFYILKVIDVEQNYYSSKILKY